MSLFKKIYTSLWLLCLGAFFVIHSLTTHAAEKEATILPVTSPNCNQFTFDAAQSRNIDERNVSYFWDLGDGTTGTDSLVTHTYAQPGDYTVTLKITDRTSGIETAAETSQVVRAVIPPTAAFISEDRACVNEPVHFDATASSNPGRKRLRYFWDFGDGVTRERESRVTTTFPNAGNHTVYLTVDNGAQGQCGRQSAEKTVQIQAPPRAEAGDDFLFKCVEHENDLLVQFDAYASTGAAGNALSYFWNFGDGLTGQGKQVTHRYPKPGHYEAWLYVNDHSGLNCSTDIDFVSVRLNEAPVARIGGETSSCVGDEILFDGSNSYIPKPGTVLAQWVLGDNTIKYGLQVRHRYASAGIYQATLTLENKLNSQCPISRDTRAITVNSAPQVTLQGPENACVGQEISFDASAASDPDNDPLNYFWSFGDGTTARIGARAKHTYSVGGTYRVSVIADDQKGTKCSTADAYITVHVNTPPEADAGPNTACCAEQEVNFSADGSFDPDNDQLTYTWTLGDGTTQHGPHVRHTYQKGGSYQVAVTVDDNTNMSCSRSSDGFTAVVRDMPQPVITIR